MNTKVLLLIVVFLLGFYVQAQTYVPDDNFEQALIDLGYDSGAIDDYVPTANINAVTSLNISWQNISDLTGIEDFTALETFYCRGNQLSTIDLSSNLAITYLDCNQNILTMLDLALNTNLSILNCSQNQIEDLDLSNNTALSNLNCSYNSLTTLNLKNGTNTTNFANYWDFNATFNSNLECIEVDDANWSASTWIDIDTQTYFSENCHYGFTYVPDDNFEQELINLGYDSGPLDDEVLPININTITNLDLSNLNISDLTGIRDFIALETLQVQNNQLTSIDLEYNIALEILDVGNNQLTSLDVTQNTALNNLKCSNNQITDLSVSQQPLLTVLQCENNQITTLDLSFNNLLTQFYGQNNLLQTLNIKSGNNTIISDSNFNVSQNSPLNCIKVDDAVWSISNWNNLDAQSYYDEHCVPQVTYVPDDAFESRLILSGYDSGALDDYVPTANITGITTLNYQNLGISDLTGIEDFASLYQLVVTNNSLTTLDLSNNTALGLVWCENNQLTSINIQNGANTAITSSYYFNATGNSQLQCIQVDDITYSTNTWINIPSSTLYSTDCATVMSVEDYGFLDIIVYPNPAYTSITIFGNDVSKFTYSIYDIYGKKVMTSTLTNGNTIDVSKIQSGVYFLNVSKAEKSKIIKFLKQ